MLAGPAARPRRPFLIMSSQLVIAASPSARELGIPRYRGPSRVVSSCVIFGQIMRHPTVAI
jgi:hypothetical protein